MSGSGSLKLMPFSEKSSLQIFRGFFPVALVTLNVYSRSEGLRISEITDHCSGRS